MTEEKTAGPRCTLGLSTLLWFKEKRPDLMPKGGWPRLKELQAQVNDQRAKTMSPVAQHWQEKT